MSNTKVKHTPLEIMIPKNAPKNLIVASGKTIVFVGDNDGKDKELAEFIVKACNNHDKLVEALDFGIKHIEKGINATPTGETRNEMTNFVILAKHFLESLKD